MPSSDTQFKPGQSGNPGGKPKGACSKRRLFKELVQPKSKEIILDALRLLKTGEENVQARLIIFFLDRLLPAACKDNILPDDVEIEGETFTEQAAHVKKLMNNKEITPEQGNTLLAGIKIASEIKYKEDIEKELYEVKAELAALKAKDKI